MPTKVRCCLRDTENHEYVQALLLQTTAVEITISEEALREAMSKKSSFDSSLMAALADRQGCRSSIPLLSS